MKKEIDATLRKHSKSPRQSEPILKGTKRGPVQRDVKQVMAEVLGKLTGKTVLDARANLGFGPGGGVPEG